MPALATHAFIRESFALIHAQFSLQLLHHDHSGMRNAD